MNNRINKTRRKSRENKKQKTVCKPACFTEEEVTQAIEQTADYFNRQQSRREEVREKKIQQAALSMLGLDEFHFLE